MIAAVRGERPHQALALESEHLGPANPLLERYVDEALHAPRNTALPEDVKHGARDWDQGSALRDDRPGNSAPFPLHAESAASDYTPPDEHRPAWASLHERQRVGRVINRERPPLRILDLQPDQVGRFERDQRGHVWSSNSIAADRIVRGRGCPCSMQT